MLGLILTGFRLFAFTFRRFLLSCNRHRQEHSKKEHSSLTRSKELVHSMMTRSKELEHSMLTHSKELEHSMLTRSMELGHSMLTRSKELEHSMLALRSSRCRNIRHRHIC